MLDNQIVFATIFVIIHTHDIYITITIQNVFDFIYRLVGKVKKSYYYLVGRLSKLS
jgi:hypothetical protein